MTETTGPRFPKRSGRRAPKGRTASTLLANGGTRVATYTRISTDEVNQPYSLEAQAEHLTRFMSLRPEWSKTAAYTDQATGSKIERPGLQRLLDDVRAGKIDVVLVYRVDRFSRSLRDLQDLIETLEDHDVAFISATEPFDTSNSMGRMILNILGVFAEFERAVLIDRIRSGNAAKASRGEWVGGKPPYGYEVTDGKTLKVIDSEASVVREIFRMCMDKNMGGLAIAMALNDAGYRSRGKTMWDSKKVIGILRRPTYAGWIVHHDETFPGLHPAIIDPDVFDKVQEILDERGTPWDRRSDAFDYYLTGLLKCTNCGSSMIAERTNSGSGNSYRYYICRRRKMVARTACHSPRISADVLEKAVMDALISVYSDYGLFTAAAERAIAARADTLPKTKERLAGVEAEIVQVESATQRYLAAFESGSMDPNLCGPRLAELQHQWDSLQAHRSELQAIIDAPEPVLPSKTDTKAMATGLKEQLRNLTGPELKNLLRLLIDRVLVSPDRIITPYVRVPDIGTARLADIDAAAGDEPGDAIPVAVTVSSDRLWSAGRTRDKVLEAFSALEVRGLGPEISIPELIDEVLKSWPDLKRDSVRRIIDKDMCRSRGGRPISLVKGPNMVVRRATAEESST